MGRSSENITPYRSCVTVVVWENIVSLISTGRNERINMSRWTPRETVDFTYEQTRKFTRNSIEILC